MKRIWLTISISLCISLWLVMWPPAISTHTDDISNYLQTNSYVGDILATRFRGMLPPLDSISIEKAQYYYLDNCAFGGIPNFCIYLENFPEDDLYLQEVIRLKEISTYSLELSDGRTLFSTFELETSLKKYADSVIYDGRTLYFELAVSNSSTQSVKYLTALQTDEKAKDEIIKCLHSLLEDDLFLFLAYD